MSFFNWVKNKIWPQDPETPLERDIRRTKAALYRYEKRLGDMVRCWRENELPCCPACAFSPEYSYLVDKIERVEAWLKILEDKNDSRNT